MRPTLGVVVKKWTGTVDNMRTYSEMNVGPAFGLSVRTKLGHRRRVWCEFKAPLTFATGLATWSPETQLPFTLITR